MKGLGDFLMRKKVPAENGTAPAPDQQDSSVESDRGIPSVNMKKRTPIMVRSMQILILLLGLGLAAVSIKAIVSKVGGSKAAEAPAADKKKEAETITNHAPLDLSQTPALPDGDTPALPASSPAVPAIQGAAPGASGQQAQAIPVNSTSQHARNGNDRGAQGGASSPEARRLKKGMAYQAGDRDAGQQGAGGAESLLGLPGGGQGTGAGLGPLLSSTKTAMSTARLLPDPDWYVPKGTVVDCVIQEAIDTTQPGMLNCVGSNDVYSASQRVVLMEAGTIYHIEYQKGLMQGQNKIFMLVSDARTPGNVEVPMDSPVNDALGRAGVGGEVNTHFWDRFGGALMLGVIGDVGQGLANSMSKGNSAYTVNNTAGGAQQAMAEAIRATINIPPSMQKNQAGHIKLYVARHLDFRSVYGLASN